jgi:hypothetical protein
MEAPQNMSRPSGSAFSFITLLFILIGAVLIYYVYTLIIGSRKQGVSQLIGSKLVATKAYNDKTSPAVPEIPTIYAGGDYTVNFWIYVNSYNTNRNRRKHILELYGKNFSTLFVGLGAYQNSLVVRTTDVADPTVTGASGASGATGSSITGSSSSGTKLTPTYMNQLLGTNTADTQHSSTSTMDKCDILEVDLQRWVMVSVVLSGRLVDVYIDGKLARSCTMNSFYQVDPTGVSMRLSSSSTTGEPGFDGYISNVDAAAYMLTPDEIYKLYLEGPEGKSTLNIFNWITSLFTGKR